MTQQNTGTPAQNNNPPPDHSNRNFLITLVVVIGVLFGVRALYRKYTSSRPNVNVVSTDRQSAATRQTAAQPSADAGAQTAEPADTAEGEPDEEVDAGPQQANEPDAGASTSDQPPIAPQPRQTTQQPTVVAQTAPRPPPVTRRGWTCPAGRICVSGADAPNQTCDNAHPRAGDGLCLRRFSMAFVRAVDIISAQHPTCTPGRMCIDCRNLTDRESGWSTWSSEIPTRNDLGRCAVILP